MRLYAFKLNKTTTMSRAQIISKTIQSFNHLRSRTDELFAESTSNGKVEIMANELFESKLNPFLRELYKTVREIPLNDYTIIAIDSWIKQLNSKIETTKNSLNDTGNFSLKYMPSVIDSLNEVKLEVLELLLTETENLEYTNKNQYRPLVSQSPLTPKGIAMLLVQLQNFGVIRPDIPFASISEVLAPFLGCEANEIEQHIYFDKENRRQSAKANNDDLVPLVKIMKSIIGRIENRQYVNEILKNEVD